MVQKFNFAYIISQKPNTHTHTHTHTQKSRWSTHRNFNLKDPLSHVHGDSPENTLGLRSFYNNLGQKESSNLYYYALHSFLELVIASPTPQTTKEKAINSTANPEKHKASTLNPETQIVSI